MRRGDVAVLSISAALGAVVVAAIAVSVLVVDRPHKEPDTVAANSTSSLLVVTWGPSLCQVEKSNPGCRSGHVGALGPTLILHGLWPQPSDEQFCGLPKSQQRDVTLPSLNLPQDVQSNLQSQMSDVDVMAPHEWKAHGSCSGVDPGAYFGIASTLAEQASTVLTPVFRDAKGGYVSLDAIRRTVDTAFGPGAGKRVSLSCRQAGSQGMVAYELQLSLPPVVDLRSGQTTVALGDVITKGPTLFGGCRRGGVPR